MRGGDTRKIITQLVIGAFPTLLPRLYNAEEKEIEMIRG
jgi:hypothetical protein